MTCSCLQAPARDGRAAGVPEARPIAALLGASVAVIAAPRASAVRHAQPEVTRAQAIQTALSIVALNEWRIGWVLAPVSVRRVTLVQPGAGYDTGTRLGTIR